VSRQIQIAILGAAALLIGGGGFAAGMAFAPAAPSSVTTGGVAPDFAAALQQRRAAGGAAPGAAIGAAAGGQIAGRVISVADGSITVETRQAGTDTARSVIALVGGSTRIVRTTETEISLSDIKPGDQVFVVGQPDQASGTLSANAILVGETALQLLRPGGTRGASPSPSAP